ncbi:MAG: PLDc N-terminal domain-containing protein [Sediminibacterium sp.]
MKQNMLLYYSYAIAIIGILVGAWVKIMHFQGADILLGICILSQIVFAIAAIIEVNKSNSIDKSEKSMWITSLIFMPVIAGLIYLKQGRRRVIG